MRELCCLIMIFEWIIILCNGFSVLSMSVCMLLCSCLVVCAGAVSSGLVRRWVLVRAARTSSGCSAYAASAPPRRWDNVCPQRPVSTRAHYRAFSEIHPLWYFHVQVLYIYIYLFYAKLIKVLWEFIFVINFSEGSDFYTKRIIKVF